MRAGPKAGDRLPDAPLVRDGRRTYIQQELAGPHLQLLLCGAPEAWDRSRVAELTERYAGLLVVHHLTRSEVPGAIIDSRGEALARLGVRGVSEAAQYLVRPDGHIGFRCAGRDLQEVGRYLASIVG